MSYPHYSAECGEHHDLVRDFGVPGVRPEIVCLCGSTRFAGAFIAANRRLTLEGKIVLSVGLYGHGEGLDMGGPVKRMLDELHKRKIDLADRVLVLNVGGYIGESTRSEITYAEAIGCPVDYLHPLEVRVSPVVQTRVEGDNEPIGPPLDWEKGIDP